MDPLEEGPTIILKFPESMSPHTVQDMKPELPKETPGVCKSSRLKFQTKNIYIIIMAGSKYAIAVAHLEYYRVLHPDSHIFFIKFKRNIHI